MGVGLPGNSIAVLERRFSIDGLLVKTEDGGKNSPEPEDYSIGVLGK